MASTRKSVRKPAAKRPIRRPARTRTVASRGPAVRKAPARASRKATPATKALRLAGVGSAAVFKATGRAWEEWLKVLDHAGAKAMPHKEIALLLSRKFAVPDWWSQMVTVGYEQARGLRKPHQNTRGFSASVSRTLGIPLDKLYTAWSEPRQRSRWLPGAPLEVRRSTDGKSLRMTWTVGSTDVDVNFASKGAGRSQVHIEHAKLPNSKAAVRQKAYWGSALERLKALLEGAR